MALKQIRTQFILGFVLGGEGMKEPLGCLDLIVMAVIWCGSGWLVVEGVIQIFKHLAWR